MRLPIRRIAALRTTRQRSVLPNPVLGPDGLYHADQISHLRKFDLETLAEIWKVKTGPVWIVRALEDVVVVTGYGVGVGLSTADGTEIWRRPFANNRAEWAERVLLVSGNRIEVVDLRTGQQVDEYGLDAAVYLQRAFGDTALLAAAGTAEHPRNRDPIGLFDLRTREWRWRRNLLGEIKERYGVESQNPAIGFVLGTEGRFVATYGGHTFGGSLEDGRILWCSPEDSRYAWPEVHGGRVFMLSSERKDFFVTHFVALDEATGETIYDVPMTDHSPPLVKKLGRATQPLVLEGHLAYATESGFLVAFRESDGRPVWHYRHKHELFRGLVAGRRAFVPSADGNILVFEEDGAST